MKILVVHRQKETVGVIKSVLSKKNPVVLQTESGLDGLLTSRIEHFDLIICGTDLPVVTGFELTRSIRTNSVNRNTPIFLIASTVDDQMERLAKQLGVESILAEDEIGAQLEDLVHECMKLIPQQEWTDMFTRSRIN